MKWKLQSDAKSRGGVGLRQKCRTLLCQTPIWKTNHSWRWWLSSSLSYKSNFVAFSVLFLQSFSALQWLAMCSCILLALLQVCAICMHCSMPKVGNVEFSIAASPGVCMKPNTCNGLHCSVCMQKHLQKNAKNIHKLHKTTLKIFLLLSASFPSPDSSFEEDRPQSVSSSLENSFNLIFPAADHYWESNTRWLRLLRWILPGGLSFQTFVRHLKF